MAKSYKKYPIVKQEKVDKKIWNRKIRRLDIDFSFKGSLYKKLIPNWDTWQYPWFLDEAIDKYNNSSNFPNEEFPTLESYIEFWKRCCVRK